MTLFQQVKSFIQNRIIRRLNSLIAMLLVTAICLGALFLQYFSRADAVSLATVAASVIVPFQNGINEIGSYFFDAEQERISLQEAKEQIEALKEENEELKAKIWDLSTLEMENGELRALLSARERYGNYEMTHAQVIGNSGSNAFYRITLNKGSADGISLNMNVINEDGLIGLVTTVGLNYCIVTTIIEDRVSVSGTTKFSHENCIVTGALTTEGPRTMTVTNVSKDIDFDKDSTLITSHISDKYLPDIPIGNVYGMTENGDGLTQSGYLKTAVDFTNLNHVLIITTLLQELEEE